MTCNERRRMCRLLPLLALVAGPGAAEEGGAHPPTIPEAEGVEVVAPDQSSLATRRGGLAAARAALRRQQTAEGAAAVEDAAAAGGGGASNVPPGQARWQVSGRAAVGAGYDSNPQRRGEITDGLGQQLPTITPITLRYPSIYRQRILLQLLADDTSPGPEDQAVVKGDLRLRAAYTEGVDRLSIGLGGSMDFLPEASDDSWSNLGLNLGWRHTWPETGGSATVLSTTVDGRRFWLGADGVAWSGSAAVELARVDTHFVHGVRINATHLAYDAASGDDGTGAWLGWRSWWMPKPGRPRPRLEAELRIGHWSADAAYDSGQAALAFRWRSGEDGRPHPWVVDVDLRISGEYRHFRSSRAAVLPHAWIYAASGDLGLWLTPWLKTSLYGRYDGRDSRVASDDYDRIQAGLMLAADF